MTRYFLLNSQVILFSEGFSEAKSLGRKLVAVFNMSRDMLTPQQHYDWGLRSLKTVLGGCGKGLHDARVKMESAAKGKDAAANKVSCC